MNKSVTVRAFLKDLYESWSADKPARLAAALAYYGMFSLAPMLYVALTVAGIFIDELATADELFARLGQILGQETAQFIYDMVVGASQRTAGGTTLSSLISLGALLYAATGLFAHLKYSLNIIWQAPPPKWGGVIDYILTRLLAFAMVLGVGLILILVTFMSIFGSILTTFFNYGGDLILGNVAGFVALATFSLALIYRMVPDVNIAWRDVWPGALITALIFAIGRWGLGFYLTHSSISSAFQAAGALAIVLIAIYYSAMLFLFGAMFTKVYANSFGSRAGNTIEPDLSQSDITD